MRRHLSLLSMLVAAAILATAAPAAARDKIALGIADPAADWDPAVIDAHTQAVGGQRPSIWAVWNNWGPVVGNGHPCAVQVFNAAEYCAFPTAQVDQLHARGVDAIIWWQPQGPQDNYSRYRAITAGQHDDYLKQWARDAKAAAQRSGRPIFVRFAHEATGKWFPWGIREFDNNRSQYKAAWRHLHKVFSKVGARKHVRFVWSNVFPYKWAYPGDKYVDYVGLTILNFGAERKWRSMSSQVNKKAGNAKRFTKRPILLNEVATNYLGGDKYRWIKNGYLKAYRQQPKVKGIMYLDTDVPAQSGQPDWRLSVPDGSGTAAYAWLANKNKFKGQLR